MTSAVESATGEPIKPKDVAEPGTTVTVSWGEETFSPVQYNSFRIGGHSVTLTVRDGESALDAWKRGWAMLQEAADIEFQDKMSGFAKRINQSKNRG